MREIKIELNKHKKPKPQNEDQLGFGKVYTDHMFLMNYDEGDAWHDPRIVPYAPILLDPASTCLHYGQEVYEGMKAYRTKDEKLLLFRPQKNMQRLNASNQRLCIPKIDEEFCQEAIKRLVYIEKDWVPKKEGTALYIRPFIIATDPFIGVKPAKHFLLIIICSPVSAYYSNELGPVKIYVEENYVRAVRGGVGFAKTAANYAAALKSQAEAEKIGYAQVLWLDAIERKYVEEVGTMNVFFVIGDEIVTPMLQGSILPGITRLSCIELLRSWGREVSERRLSIQEIHKAYLNGSLKEAFGTGTAAVISPIGELKWGDNIITINRGEPGPVANQLYDVLTGIQRGEKEDKMGWTILV